MIALDVQARGLAQRAKLAAAQAAVTARLGRILARASVRNPVDLAEGAGALATLTPKAHGSPTSGLTQKISLYNSPLLFQWAGGVGQFFAGFPGWQANVVTLKSGGNAYNDATRGNTAQRLSWLTDAVSMDLSTYFANYRVLIDGVYVGKTVRTDGITAGGVNWINVATADTSRKLRRIDIEIAQGGWIEGTSDAGNYPTIVVGANDTLAPVDTSNRLTIAVVGDSFSTNTGASFAHNGWAVQLGYLLGGIDADVREIAIGGTGWQVDAGQYTYAQRTGDLGQASFDLVIFAGGINDTTATGEQAAVLAALQSARAVQPSALFVVLGSWCGTSGASATNLAVEAAIQAGVAQFGDPNTLFVPVLTDPAGSWITGTNGAAFGSGDGTHPGDAGHGYLARRANAAIRSLLKAKLDV